MTDTENTDQKTVDDLLLLLSPEDNVVVARRTLKKGTDLVIDGVQVQLDQDAPAGFKIARGPIGTGVHILKYGAHIGSAKTDITAGAVVHLHNMQSDYLPTYTHDGDSFTQKGGH